MFFWKGLNLVHLSINDNRNFDDVRKIASVNDHVFVLTTSNWVFHGFVQFSAEENEYWLNVERVAEFHDTSVIDIGCDSQFVYVVERNGGIFKVHHERLVQREEIEFDTEKKLCPHGYRENEQSRLKIRHVRANQFGCLFVTETGQLWAIGEMPQVETHPNKAKRIVFNSRFVIDAAVGIDFAAVLVRKHSQISFENQEDDTDTDEDVFVSSCPKCASVTTSSSISQPSLSDVCPLDLQARNSSSNYSSNSEQSHKKHISSESGSKEGNDTSDTEECDEKKNIIFRNTEAAREFLTRQFSWMSAGEEYLAECTEGPTRIIKQNVSNVASLVYEGVKTVGDKVVTLSRHVSGSSDPNDEAAEEIFNDDYKQIMSNLNSNGNIEEFPWSSSAGTSEKDLSDRDVLNRSNLLIKSGNSLLNTEVWSWGNIEFGQLGLGDSIKRTKPALIPKLSNLGVQKLVAGNYHCAALTLDGRIFLWGRNNHHQVTLDNSEDQSSPKLLRIDTKRVQDIACGDYQTLAFTNDYDLYFFGKHSNESGEKLIHLNKNIQRKRVNQENLFKQNRVLTAGTISCFIFNCSKFNFVSNLLQDEQYYFEVSQLVNNTVIKQFQKKSEAIISLEMNIYETLCRCYGEILSFTAANIYSLIETIATGNQAIDSVMFVQNGDEHVALYRNYLNAICDVIALNGFSHIAKLIDIPQAVTATFQDTLGFKKAQKKSNDSTMSTIFYDPLKKIEYYIKQIETFKKESPSKGSSKVNDLLDKWKKLNSERDQRCKDAELTKHFWETSGKVVELLRSPERRLVRESKTYPLSYLNSGRFSSHWFVLLTDVFVHLNGTTQTVHPLVTIWVEPLQDTDSLQNAIQLVMPEETLTLYTSTPQAKNEWLQSLQNAIKMRMKKTNAFHPPCIRTAGYIFTKQPLKDAKYMGRWCNGKLHGNGKLEWSDGRIYCGQFQNNSMSGFGRMDIPNIGCYEGQWKEGVQNGSGTMRYSSGDIYEGYFKDGQPHGHGILKQGHFMANAASVYVGEWVGGVKQGYGVIDNISTGEKYMGNWQDNKKHGCGLIVTLDGIYYEGVFNQDILTGHGVMIFEDGTHYEGEFKAAGFLNGRGVLTLNSGDRIEGTLNGAWNEGVKISNATLHMKVAETAEDSTSKPVSFGKLCVVPAQKWKAIFQQCQQALCLSNENNDSMKIWQNVAVLMSNSKQNGIFNRNNKSLSKSRKIKNDELNESFDQLDTIPQFGQNKLNKEEYNDIKLYLQKAFECLYHPLASVLLEISAAYTATYGGVRVHPLLLSHAVEELRSITDRIYEIVRLLFPALSPIGKELVFDLDNQSEVVNATGLLHPFLLPRVHSALFILYTLHNKKEDDAYWKRLLKWNKQPDTTLMAFLGIDQKFWKSSSVVATTPQELLTAPIGEQIYSDAIEHLQQLKTTFSPLEKLYVLRETFQKMTTAMQNELGKNYVWTMDDLFPLFYYVVVRARILQLGSEIHFIEDFMEPILQNGELGIMFTILKACYYQILQEKINMTC